MVWVFSKKHLDRVSGYSKCCRYKEQPVGILDFSCSTQACVLMCVGEAKCDTD